MHTADIPEWDKVKQDLKHNNVPNDLSRRISSGISSRMDEKYIKPLMTVVKEHQGKSAWNEMFYSINQLEDLCVYFTNDTMLSVPLHSIYIPRFTEFKIEISDKTSEENLKAYERMP